MPFNSLIYFLFLPAVYIIFLLAGERARWVVLLAASLVFYANLKVPYLLVALVIVVAVTYVTGIWLGKAQSAKIRRALLWSGVSSNILILVMVKYLPFLSENLREAALFWANFQIQPVKAFIAIGISYYIFQAISYLFDIYFELEKPERHFGYFALYLSFFPKLLQGPIERASDLIPQLKTSYQFNYENMRSGIVLFAWGLFQKVVIADRLGLQVDAVYNNVQAYSGLPLLLATYAYAFQIYFDFSGYTHMAIGSARLFNINLTPNFNSPYLATSIADFWRRWHITFSRWILDFVFRPLQMQWRYRKNWGTATALVVTFFISGIWHGASWGFIIWGGLHGMYLACSVFYKPYQKRLYQTLRLNKNTMVQAWQIFITFNMVSFAWIFFRAANLADATHVATHLCTFTNPDLKTIPPYKSPYEIVLVLVLLLVPLSVALLRKRVLIFEQPAWVRWSIYYALGIATILFSESSANFLYFRF